MNRRSFFKNITTLIATIPFVGLRNNNSAGFTLPIKVPEVGYKKPYHMFISKEALEDVKNWCQIDEKTRRKIYPK